VLLAPTASGGQPSLKPLTDFMLYDTSLGVTTQTYHIDIGNEDQTAYFIPIMGTDAP
jgi:hypothetical protein